MRKVKVPPRLWLAIGAVETAGQKLSNIAFNITGRTLAQREILRDLDRCICDEARKEWAEAQHRLSSLLR